ncbi:MAG TPA: cysteine desulfurase family protein, partial [Acidimicrobiales bacterium]|nr:cysteine desulfurase family protein [Acidimicrobiales bacterium]
REVVAAALAVNPGDVVFTSGGTEADNLAVFGVLGALDGQGSRGRPGGRDGPIGPMVCSAMEHPAVLNACRAAAVRYGVELREVPTDAAGIVDLDRLAEACTDEVSLVSVMAVNNELGTVQPLGDVATLVHDRSPHALLHTDAVQAVPWLDVAEHSRGADLVSISAHKFGGPQGIGALAVRNGVALAPLIHGGGQERERRSGTPNVAGIVAMAEALQVTNGERAETVARVAALRDRLLDGLVERVDGAVATAARCATVAGIAHLRIPGVESEALVVLLDQAGVAASAGASCASGAVEPSHVLLAMGLSREAAVSGMRFSLGHTTSTEEIDLALAAVPDGVSQLRN